MAQIVVEKYNLPGGSRTYNIYIKFLLVDGKGNPIVGFRQSDNEGIIGALEFRIDDEPIIVDLIPNEEIYPLSYWSVGIYEGSNLVRSSIVSIIEGPPLTIPELFQLTREDTYWDVMANRLLPDPISLPIDTYVFNIVNDGSGNRYQFHTAEILGMQPINYDPSGIRSDVFNLGNHRGNLDGGVF